MGWDKRREALLEIRNGLSLKGLEKVGKGGGALWCLFDGVTGEHHNRAELGPSADVQEGTLAGIGASLLTNYLAIYLWTSGHKPFECGVDQALGL